MTQATLKVYVDGEVALEEQPWEGKQGDQVPVRGSVTGSLGSCRGKGRRNPICRTEAVLETVTLCVVLVR